MKREGSASLEGISPSDIGMSYIKSDTNARSGEIADCMVGEKLLASWNLKFFL